MIRGTTPKKISNTNKNDNDEHDNRNALTIRRDRTLMQIRLRGPVEVMVEGIGPVTAIRKNYSYGSFRCTYNWPCTSK